MSTAQPRRPAGVPAGDQFSTKDQPAPGYTLDDDATINGRPVEPEVTTSISGARVEYYRNGRLQDPDDGRPANVSYRTDGTVEHEEHYRNGRLQNPGDGRPAVVEYHTDGTVKLAVHWQQGSGRANRRLSSVPRMTDFSAPPPK